MRKTATRKIALFVVFTCFFGAAHAQFKGIGRAIGEVGAGAAESALSGQPFWDTIQPGSKEDCLKESGGNLNNVYVRCRNGRQEYVRIDSQGRRYVLQERSIPAHMVK